MLYYNFSRKLEYTFLTHVYVKGLGHHCFGRSLVDAWCLIDAKPLHWNGNVVILTKFSSLAALEVVILTTFSAASDENFIKMKTFPFQCTKLLLIDHFPNFSQRFMMFTTSSPFNLRGLTLISAWISNYIHYKVWGEITYLFLNFNGATVEV